MRSRNLIEWELPLGFISTCPAIPRTPLITESQFSSWQKGYLGIPRSQGQKSQRIPYLLQCCGWRYSMSSPASQEMPISGNTRRDIPGLKSNEISVSYQPSEPWIISRVNNLQYVGVPVSYQYRPATDHKILLTREK